MDDKQWEKLCEWALIGSGDARYCAGSDEFAGDVVALIASHEAQDEEILALHRKLAAETLRADQGWARYEAANSFRKSNDRVIVEQVERIRALQVELEATVEYSALQANYAKHDADVHNWPAPGMDDLLDAKCLESVTMTRKQLIEFRDRAVAEALAQRGIKE